jgi:steroid delta-isomerase-like uncharacterized protein
MAVVTLEKQTITELLDGFFDAYNRHDLDALLGYCTEDVLWEDPTAGILHGRQPVRSALRNVFTAFPDMKFAKDEVDYFISLDGTRAASSWRLTGTMKGPLDPPGYAPTGGTVDIKGVCLYVLEDGLIAHHTIVFDMIELGRQIDALPPAGSLMDKMVVRLQNLKVRRRNR